jgi:hypothetical protein
MESCARSCIRQLSISRSGGDSAMTQSRISLLMCVLAVVGTVASGDQGVSPPAEKPFLSEMTWRMIGPHRGGRTKAGAGVPDQPNVFYIGVCNGASGRRPITAGPGCPSSTTSRPDRLARLPSRRPIPTSSMSAAARGCNVQISQRATASTSRQTPARRGYSSVFETASRFHKSSWTEESRQAVCRRARSSIRTERRARSFSFD